MARWDKYVKRAFETLGYEPDPEVKTKSDLEYWLRLADETVSANETIIAEAEDRIRSAKESKDQIQEIYDQVEIEEIKAMNPNAVAVYKL